jgi:hypothetical protein
MRFQRGGACKRIVAPDGSELVPPTGPARQRHGQGGRPCLPASTWPGATKPTNLRATIVAGARLGRARSTAQLSARLRAPPGRAPVSRWHLGACESGWR